MASASGSRPLSLQPGLWEGGERGEKTAFSASGRVEGGVSGGNPGCFLFPAEARARAEGVTFRRFPLPPGEQHRLCDRGSKGRWAPGSPWWARRTGSRGELGGLLVPPPPAEGAPRWTAQNPAQEKASAWPRHQFGAPRGWGRPEVIQHRRQLPHHRGRQAPGSQPHGPNSRESGRRHFSIDSRGLGEGPTATATAAAAERRVGLCALVSGPG